jgi:hypothetical protein
MAKSPKAGRKARVEYSKAKGLAIAKRIASGASWSRLCHEKGMPAYPTLYVWMRKHPEFAEAMAQARTMAADWKADEALEVARERGTPTLEVNTLMTHAARMAPTRWGPKAGLDEAADAPKRLVIVIRNFVPVTLPDGQVISRELLEDGSYVDEA